MQNDLFENYSEEEIINAAKRYLREKIGWDEEPIKVIADVDSILLVYEKEGENYVDDSIHDDGIYAVYVKGKRKKICWIEFERYNGLIKYLSLPNKV